MTHGKWVSQQNRRYGTLSTCPEHGDFLIRIRLAPEEDGTIKVVRLIYEGSSEAAQAFAEEKEKVKPRVRKRRSRKRADA